MQPNNNRSNDQHENSITEEQLDALYIYLMMNVENMSYEELVFWNNLLLTYDNEYKIETHEQKNNGLQP
jgi:hypothetical protein